MRLVPIATVAREIQVGTPLRFGVRDQDGSLLLAKGFVVHSERTRDSLLARGAFVDMDELEITASTFEPPAETPLQTFIGTWDRLQNNMGGFLRSAPTQDDAMRIMACVSHVISLCDSSTEEQRQHIHRHPLEAVALLRRIGITDEKWLAAVEQHHETATGSGYPAQLQTPTEMSQVLRYIDMFIAKLSARATRLAELPNVAARRLFTQNQGDPLVAVVIKEFGIYPPGCYVKLASGELAIVTRSGAHAHTPVVAALTNSAGYGLVEPFRRDTSKPEHAIKEIVGENEVFVRPSWSRLHALSFGHSERPIADMSRVAI